MNIILLLIISILIVILSEYNNYSCKNNKELSEKFDILSNIDKETDAKYKSDYDSSKPTYTSSLTYNPKLKMSCCLVKKKYLPNNNLYGGAFKYTYKPLENENCDLKLYRLDSNAQLFIDGENNWSNQNCKTNANNNKLGSCRNINKECIDFVTQDYCSKYKMTWSEKTCHDPLEYKWVDRINLKLPKLKDDGAYVMFDKVSKLGKIVNK